MEEDYPRSLPEFDKRFADEESCLDYIIQLRWGDSFVCPKCGGSEFWKMQRGLRLCRNCRHQASVTAGTIFDRTRKPLGLWFRAMWHITNQKYGANALGLQRILGLGSYQTAWEWLHKLRRAMVRPDRDGLSGIVQVDETYIGGKKKPGKRGRGAAGKTVVGIAVEDKGEKGIGRIRLSKLTDASSISLNAFLYQNVDRGSNIITDNWSGYAHSDDAGYKREILASQDITLPHLVAGLLKRWLLGTYQGAARASHLDYYLDEYTFRFNRRKSHSRGKLFYRLLQQALLVDPHPRSTLKAIGGASMEDEFDDIWEV
jgi:transposase-like protein